MKTPEELAGFLQDLQEGLAQPCNCRRNGHAEACRRGADFCKAAIVTLEWALDLDPRHDALVRELRERAAAYRQEGN